MWNRIFKNVRRKEIRLEISLLSTDGVGSRMLNDSLSSSWCRDKLCGFKFEFCLQFKTATIKLSFSGSIQSGKALLFSSTQQKKMMSLTDHFRCPSDAEQTIYLALTIGTDRAIETYPNTLRADDLLQICSCTVFTIKLIMYRIWAAATMIWWLSASNLMGSHPQILALFIMMTTSITPALSIMQSRSHSSAL